MATTTARLTGSSAYQWGALTLFAAVAVILTALGYEHLGGYEPCPLCLQQRYAYYAAIPVMFLALVMQSSGQTKFAAGLFFIVAAAFLANAGLGVYHAGVEWSFWPGPSTCSDGIKPINSGPIKLSDLAQEPAVMCGVAQGRFLGLSFAGWNVVACLGLMIGALKAAFATSGESR